MDDIREGLRRIAARLGFCALGVAPARLEPEFACRLEGAAPPFVRHRPGQRIAACGWLSGARSVVAVAWPYHQRYSQPLVPAEDEGYFSPFALAPDYHRLVKEKLVQLGREFARLCPGSRHLVQVDAGPACERLYALRAGVGWQGKNNFIIVPGHGSLVWLGLLTTDAALAPDKPLESRCGSCTRCLDACPTNAYQAAGALDFTRCLAYLAASRQALSGEQCRALSRQRIIYGCDICQLACPYTKVSGLEPVEWPKLSSLLELSKSEYNRRFGTTSAAWRGRWLLRRNAIIAAGGVPDLAPSLRQLAGGEGKAAEYARRALADFR